MMPEVKFVKENKVVKKNALKINTKFFLFFLFEKLTLEIINCIGTFGGKSLEESWLTLHSWNEPSPMFDSQCSVLSHSVVSDSLPPHGL